MEKEIMICDSRLVKVRTVNGSYRLPLPLAIKEKMNVQERDRLFLYYVENLDVLFFVKEKNKGLVSKLINTFERVI